MQLCFCSRSQRVDLAHSYHLYPIRLEQSPTADLLYSNGEFPDEGRSPETDLSSADLPIGCRGRSGDSGWSMTSGSPAPRRPSIGGLSRSILLVPDGGSSLLRRRVPRRWKISLDRFPTAYVQGVNSYPLVFSPFPLQSRHDLRDGSVNRVPRTFVQTHSLDDIVWTSVRPADGQHRATCNVESWTVEDHVFRCLLDLCARGTAW